jgi:hypothetical protein
MPLATESEIERAIASLTAKRDRPLTEKQTLFLQHLVGNDFNIKEAMKEAGYGRQDKVGLMRSLHKEIVGLAESFLLSKAPEAIGVLAEIMVSDEAIPQANVKLQAAKEVLDRIGIVKKEELNISHTHSGGILILPSKKPIDMRSIEEGVYA